MRSKVRALAAGLLSALMILPMTGCHGAAKTVSFEVPQQFDDSTPIEISFWAKNDTNKSQTKVYENAIEEFEKLYPNVTVNLKLYTDYSRIYNDVITNISTNTTPNVCITYPDHIATYMTGQDVVVPLDELFADSRYGFGGSELKYDGPDKSELIPKFMDECKLDGNYYAVPFMRSTEALYVNKTYVEALGYELPEAVTWDFVWEVSEKALEKNEDGTYVVNGQEVMIPFIYKSTDNMMITMLEQLGGGYSTAAGDILIDNDTTRQILYTVAEHVETGAFSTFKISSYPGNYMNAGQCIFAVDSTAGASWMGADAPHSDIAKESKVEFETVVMEVPQYDLSNPKMISQGPSICIFNKSNPQEVLASWLFTQFLVTNEIQCGYSETEGYVPVTYKARECDQYKDYLSRRGEDFDEHYYVKIDATQLLLDHTNDTFVTPVFNGSASLRSAASQLIENTAKAVRRNQTVDEAFMEQNFEDVTSLYHLDQIQTNASVVSDLGPLPPQSIWLMVIIGVTWLGIILFYVLNKVKSNRKR